MLASLLAKMLVLHLIPFQAVLILKEGSMVTEAKPSCWHQLCNHLLTHRIHPVLFRPSSSSLAVSRRPLTGLSCPQPLHPEPCSHSWYFTGNSWQYRWCPGGRTAGINRLRIETVLPKHPTPEALASSKILQTAGQVGRQGPSFPTGRESTNTITHHFLLPMVQVQLA